MPFPWKKKKNRISQIVADLQSPKRGGSLVVETGFPTSLIDLFVKNRSRFTKTRSTKPAPTETPDHSPPPPPPSPATTPPLMSEPPVSTSPKTESPRPTPINQENSVSDRVRECGSGPVPTVVVIKVLVVAVLVASVKRLTVGITVSAFALLLLEYAGKRAVSCLRVRPCADASVPIESLIRRVSSHLRFQKVRIQLKPNEVCDPATDQLISVSSNVDEIEIVEANCDLGIGPDQLDSSMVMEPLASDFKVIRGSRSGRFKSQVVKKLVPKKFRSCKKEKKGKGDKQNEAESGSEVSSVVGDEEKLQSVEIEEVGEDVRREEIGSKRLSFLLRTELDSVRHEVNVDYGGITCSQESPPIEEKGIESAGNSGYTILVIITLVGLLVGRFPALILTMAWCLLLKIVKVFCR